MTDNTSDITPWQTATKSGAGQNCVQLRRNGQVVELRDSKDPEGPIHRFTRGEIDAFLDGAKKGEFDNLL